MGLVLLKIIDKTLSYMLTYIQVGALSFVHLVGHCLKLKSRCGDISAALVAIKVSFVRTLSAPLLLHPLYSFNIVLKQ